MPKLPTVLIVEDDILIQNVIEVVLKRGGFESEAVQSAERAVALLKANTTSYRALVTDINLKGSMTGWEVARYARQIDPEFPVIYITGGAMSERASQGVPNSIILAKPFAPVQIVTAVAQLLNIGSPET